MMAGLYIVAQIIGASRRRYTLKAAFPAADFRGDEGRRPDDRARRDGGSGVPGRGNRDLLPRFRRLRNGGRSEGPRIGGLAIGFVVAADILAIGPLTGASMNPARSFGPAVASGIYEAQLLYLFAPIVGAMVAGLLYEYLFMRRGREPVDHGELSPSARAWRKRYAFFLTPNSLLRAAKTSPSVACVVSRVAAISGPHS